jgi:transposase
MSQEPYATQSRKTVPWAMMADKERVRIVLPGLRGEDSIAELCRKEGVAQSLYYSWSKEFLEAGKKRLAGDTARQTNQGNRVWV